MKHIFLTACAAAVIFTACNNETKTDTGTTDGLAAAKTEETWIAIDSATQMQKMMEYGTPGDMHKLMASWNGSWTSDISMWSAEGAPAQKSTGTSVNTMIVGGKYQLSKYTGNMMGMAFEGMGIMGFDNATKKFNSTWIDNMGSGIMTMTGDWDAATKTLSLTGSTPDICRPGKNCTMREVYKVVDDNTQVMEMYSPDPNTGKEYKMMEIKLTRKK